MSIFASVASAAGKVGSAIGTGVKAVGRGVVSAGKSVVSTAGKVGKVVGTGVTKVGKTVGSVGSKVGKTIGAGASKVKLVSSPKTFRVAGGGKLIRGHNSVTGKPTVRIQRPSSGSSFGSASAAPKQRTFRLMSSEQAAKFSGSRSARIGHSSAPGKSAVKFDPKPGSKFRIKSTRSADGVSSSRLVVDRRTGELLQMVRSPDPVTGKSVVKLKKPDSTSIAKLKDLFNRPAAPKKRTLRLASPEAHAALASRGPLKLKGGGKLIRSTDPVTGRPIAKIKRPASIFSGGSSSGGGSDGNSAINDGPQYSEQELRDLERRTERSSKDQMYQKKDRKHHRNETPSNDAQVVDAPPSARSNSVAAPYAAGPYYRSPKHESHSMEIEGLKFNIRGRNELTDREHQFINEQRDKTHRHKQEQFAWEQAPLDRDAERHWNLVNTGKLLYKDGKVTSDPAVIAAELERERREERLERDFKRKWLNKRRNPVLRNRSPEAQERAKANLYHKMRKESDSVAFWSAVAKNSAKKRAKT